MDSYQSDSDEYEEVLTLKKAKELVKSPRSRQVITLASCGKKVGVCEVGDPKGYPVLWFTGKYIKIPLFFLMLYM